MTDSPTVDGAARYRVTWSTTEYHEADLTAKELADLTGRTVAEVKAATGDELAGEELADQLAEIEDGTTAVHGPYREGIEVASLPA